MRGAWLDSFEFKNSKKISKTVQTRSDPSGGGGFNHAVRRARVEKGYSSKAHGKRAESREQEEHTGDERS